MKSSRTFLIFSFVFLCSYAQAREVDWKTEIAFDVAMTVGSIAVEATSPTDARYDKDEFPTQKLDNNVMRTVHGEPNEVASAKETQYRDFSNVSVILATALPAAASFFDDGQKRAGTILTTVHTVLLSNFLVTGLKYAVRRPRPEASLLPPDKEPDDNALSFPSGHSAAAFAGATLFSQLFPTSPLWLKAGGYGLATMTAWARMAGDKHYFTDVVAGGLIGAGSAIAVDASLEEESGHTVSVGPNFVSWKYRFD
ncbi:MAG: phosphatase PAP2 family protein [Oligoflexales bacterium]